MVEDQKDVKIDATATTSTPVAAPVKPAKKHNKGKKGCGCQTKAN
ncbi:MAG: hypothetical protein WCR56_04020 [Bacilli bacterium]